MTPFALVCPFCTKMEPMIFPTMHRVRQDLTSRPLGDIDAVMDERFDAVAFRERLGGTRVAVAVGSRGIDRIARVVEATVRRLREAGLEPFVIPAMGSHGGATPQGQVAILEQFGITEQAAGAPIEPSMETNLLGTTEAGLDVYMARAAMEADGIVLVNRVGLHTGYSGPIQSGVVKMVVVGLGKAEGAKALHEHGFGAGHLIAGGAALSLGALPPLLAVALLEDAARRLSELHVLPGPDIVNREPQLLERAASMWPSIPVEQADLLIVEEMGKDISGVGMDPHVTGRGKQLSPGESARFRADRIVVLRLTSASRGNATGVGHADITTKAVHDATDKVVTYRNVLTSGALHRARMPLVADSDREAVEMALTSLGGLDPSRARIVRIRSTKDLEELDVSSVLLEEVETRGCMRVESDSGSLSFDKRGGII